jgi:hypothetical protein
MKDTVAVILALVAMVIVATQRKQNRSGRLFMGYRDWLDKERPSREQYLMTPEAFERLSPDGKTIVTGGVVYTLNDGGVVTRRPAGIEKEP